MHQRNMEKHKYTSLSSHLPPRYSNYKIWDHEVLIQRAKGYGTYTQKLIEKIISSKTHPAQGYRPGVGILRLANSFGKNRLEAGCKVALDLGIYNLRQIHDILKNLRDSGEEEHVVTNSDCRGADYYQEGS